MYVEIHLMDFPIKKQPRTETVAEYFAITFISTSSTVPIILYFQLNAANSCRVFIVTALEM